MQVRPATNPPAMQIPLFIADTFGENACDIEMNRRWCARPGTRDWQRSLGPWLSHLFASTSQALMRLAELGGCLAVRVGWKATGRTRLRPPQLLMVEVKRQTTEMGVDVWERGSSG